MAARHEEIAEELRRAIDREEYTVGSRLPAGDRTRGTLRRLARHRPPGRRRPDRRGSDRVPAGRPPRGARQPPQPELRRAAQLRPVGARDGPRGDGPGGVLAVPPGDRRGRRTPPAATRHPGVARPAACAAWTANRCCWSGRCTRTGSPRPSSAIEPDCPSVTQRLFEDTGLVFAYGEHSSTRSRPARRTPNCWTSAAPARCCGSAASRRPARAARSSGPTTATARTR